MKRIKNFEKIKDEFAKVYEIINSVPSLKLSEIDVSKTFHICVDMVNGFVNEWPMHDEEIRNTIPYQISLMELAEKDPKSMNIIIKDTHKKDAIEFKKFPVHL